MAVLWSYVANFVISPSRVSAAGARTIPRNGTCWQQAGVAVLDNKAAFGIDPDVMGNESGKESLERFGTEGLRDDYHETIEKLSDASHWMPGNTK